MSLLSQRSLIETFNSVLNRRRSSLKKLSKTRTSASHISRGRSPSRPLGLPSPKEVLRDSIKNQLDATTTTIY